MRILWRYLKPQRAWIALALLLAAASHVLALVDPIIFGWIIDDYAIDRAGKTDEELVTGVLRLLALAVAVAVLTRLAKAFQEYVTRLVVQRFGAQIFNDGLRQTLRLRYQEFEDQSSNGAPTLSSRSGRSTASASTTCGSATGARAPTRSTAFRSRRGPARASPSSDRRARASRHW